MEDRKGRTLRIGDRVTYYGWRKDKRGVEGRVVNLRRFVHVIWDDEELMQTTAEDGTYTIDSFGVMLLTRFDNDIRNIEQPRGEGEDK